ncbi:hypothetical protein AVEN_45130-1 [Araneus ventricosus]|uniref:Uncharacterized protein n=1 Tax=Araneus ventricosus TaxID=182803 RepID=A0A4Y2GSS3_ARAVE|nr:hypothetical protein AVEN_45130-1 [Araneus ventricosus]
MKRQASIQNFFAKKQSVNRPVSDSVEVDCASNNVSSGVANTSTVDPAPVVEDFNQLRKNIYDIGNYCQSNSVRLLTNEEKVPLVENVWKPQPVYKFPSTFSSSSSNHSRSFQMKWLEEFESTEEEYYRGAVYVPYLDDFCNLLKKRFESHKETVASLQHILPEFCNKTDFYSSEAAFNFYEEDLSHKEVV